MESGHPVLCRDGTPRISVRIGLRLLVRHFLTRTIRPSGTAKLLLNGRRLSLVMAPFLMATPAAAFDGPPSKLG